VGRDKPIVFKSELEEFSFARESVLNSKVQILAAFLLMNWRRPLEVCVRSRNDDNGTSDKILMRISGGTPVR
jgi:hypothetical protein